MRETEPGFSVLKHPVALRLLLGHVVDPATTIAHARGARRGPRRRAGGAARGARGAARRRRARDSRFRHPSLVADWGLDYFDNERRIVTTLIERLHEEELQEEADE